MELTEINGYRTKQQLVYTTIKDSIMSGSFLPGTRLIIRNLAAKLGVSQTPVKGALTQLATEGLLEVVSHAGATVTPIRPKDVEDLYVVMGGLQGLAAERATPRVTSEDLCYLKALLDEMDGVEERDSDLRLSVLNRQFHRRICEVSGSALTVAFQDQIFDRLNRLRTVWTVIPGYREQSQAEHRLLLRAMGQRLAREARTLAEEHWSRMSQDFLDYVAGCGGEWRPAPSRASSDGESQ